MSYLDRLFSLVGKTALVTGGSSGIGRAIGTALAEAGAHVVLVARAEDRLREAASAVGADWRVADLADRAAIVRLTKDVDPDILVNAAGVNLRPPLDELSPQVWDTTLSVNLTAPFLLGQAYGPRMAARGWGRIVNLASQQAIRAFGNSGAYGVSKAGIAALTRAQAEAWSARGVCCNAIAPGFVSTAMTRPVFDDPARAEAMARRTMAGRNGEPADFAGVAVLLSGPASGYITGQTIFVDGGFSVT